MTNQEKGFYVKYPYLASYFELTKGAVELTGEGFNLGGRQRYLNKGCLISTFPNGAFEVVTDENNLENLETLLSENGFPFDKEKERQTWEINRKKEWKQVNCLSGFFIK